MRRVTLSTLATLTLSLLFVGAACDYGTSPSSKSRTFEPRSDDPRSVVQATLDAAEDLSSLSCAFDIEVQLNLDPETLTQEDAMSLGMLQGPVTVSGTCSLDSEAEVGELDLTLGMAGITYNMGFRTIGDQTWVSMLGQWYDIASGLEEYGEEDMFAEELDLEAIEARLTELDIDPIDWLGEITLVGEESLDGVGVYHLACTPDVLLIVDDILTLLSDDEFMQSLDPSGELSALMAEDLLLESDIEEARTTLAEMQTDFTVALIVGKDDDLLRQVDLSTHIAAPAGEPNEGIESVDLTIELSFDDFDEPIKVEAPENALPFSAFEEMLGSDFLSPFDGVFDDPIRS